MKSKQTKRAASADFISHDSDSISTLIRSLFLVSSCSQSFDLRSGSGIESHADGSSFDGSFANDLRNGPGTFIHAASGLKVQGQFHDGRPARQKHNAQALMP